MILRPIRDVFGIISLREFLALTNSFDSKSPATDLQLKSIISTTRFLQHMQNVYDNHPSAKFTL